MKKQHLKILSLSLFILTKVMAQQPGDIIITEVMPDPLKVSDAAGEWFEVYNTTNHDIKINAWHITDMKTKNVVINNVNPLIIKPNGYFLFALNADVNANGGLTPDFVYNFTLVNSAGKLAIIDSAGTFVDSVKYTTTNTGKSWSLDPTHYNATENDNPTNWCASTLNYGLGDFGTPKEKNSNCTITSVSDNIIRQHAIVQAWNGELSIQFPEVIERQPWEIVNITGQVVQSGTVQDMTTNFSIMMNKNDRGIYFFRLCKSNMVLKFIVQ